MPDLHGALSRDRTCSSCDSHGAHYAAERRRTLTDSAWRPPAAPTFPRPPRPPPPTRADHSTRLREPGKWPNRLHPGAAFWGTAGLSEEDAGFLPTLRDSPNAASPPYRPRFLSGSWR